MISAACVAAARIRTVVDAPLLLLTVITAAQGWRTLLYPHEIFRTPDVVTVLAIFVLMARPASPRRMPRTAVPRVEEYAELGSRL
ncbi:MAG: hypothetical protein QOE97_2111 [Pseudonocardiales bacterium]|nr:hypothetical protein [Pseudonocardiales bacterium]